MLTIIIFIRRATGVTSLLDALADAVLLALPISLFSFMLDTFGPQAKTLLLVGLVVGMILAGAGLGRLFATQTAGSRRFQAARAMTYAGGVFIVTIVFTLIFLQSRLPTELAGGRLIKVVASLAASALVFGIVLAGVIVVLRRLDPPPDAVAPVASGPTRRGFLAVGGLAIASLAGISVLGREVMRVADRKTVAVGASGELPPIITPNEDFYTVSKNFVDPSPNRGENWSIEIGGVVTQPITITRADLEAMVAPEFTSTLTCISNPIGGPLIGTARWTGAPLHKVLEKAGVGPGATELVAEGEDGYTDSFSIERALSPEPMVVWLMNGEPLPRIHGEPVRLIVPGLYGIKNVKWLTKLTVTNRDYKGYWQDRGWTDDGTIKTESRIDEPGDRGVISAGPTEIRGMAFAGDRGISKVEVSTDSGDSWHEANIFENPSPAGLSWVFWSLPWVPAQGTYKIVVRATDGTGEVQTSKGADTLPDGASGWHKITVGVA
jgi:DMSO/TMAO reductase YedYZ molybdopterin-dependent catalytic subunit